MSVESILTRTEDQKLEFKSAKALVRPEGIAREVVGMMNAGGGEIWIGVEDDKRGAPSGVSRIDDPERERDRLLDYLLETLDPPPTADEVVIEVQPLGQTDGALLVVRVQPPAKESGRLPAAFLKKGSRQFLRRVGARNHPMSREEIFGQRVSTGDVALDKATQKLLADRTAFRDSGENGLWLALQPGRQLALDLKDDRFEQLALDPSVSGNRRSGWHFARTVHHPRPPRLEKNQLVWGLWFDSLQDYVSWVRVDEEGGLRFWASLIRLHWKGECDEIWPLALLEYSVSAFRIAREIYDGYLQPEDSVAVNLALFGVSGWKLRGGTPGDYFLDPERLKAQAEPDLIWQPERISFRDLEETPDRCGYRLVRRVYQAFDLNEADMPRQYDREAGRLVLPE